MDKILTLVDIQNISIDEMLMKYSQGYRLEGLRLEGYGSVRNTSPATCTKTNGIVGDIIHLKATPVEGTASYTVKFYKDTTVIVTYTGVGENVQKTYDYTLVSGDEGSRVFKVEITDSCVGGAKSCAEQCTVTVTACSTPSCNFIVE